MQISTDNFGDLLRKLRTSRGLSLKQVAKLAKVSTTAVSSWENGEKMPKLENALSVLAILGCQVRAEPEHGATLEGDELDLMKISAFTSLAARVKDLEIRMNALTESKVEAPTQPASTGERSSAP